MAHFHNSLLIYLFYTQLLIGVAVKYLHTHIYLDIYIFMCICLSRIKVLFCAYKVGSFNCNKLACYRNANKTFRQQQL